jgi:hypothetical protein
MPRYRYVPIDTRSVPSDLRWDVPPQNQGQIVEVAYADERPEPSPACRGSRYRRTTDRAVGPDAHEYEVLVDS